MTRKRNRRRAFTMVEVLAALGLIIVLTLALASTINSQVQKANQQNVRNTLTMVNTQLSVDFPTKDTFATMPDSLESMRAKGHISEEQYRLLEGRVIFNRSTGRLELRP